MVWFERSFHSTQVRGQSLHGWLRVAQGRMGLKKINYHYLASWSFSVRDSLKYNNINSSSLHLAQTKTK